MVKIANQKIINIFIIIAQKIWIIYLTLSVSGIWKNDSDVS